MSVGRPAPSSLLLRNVEIDGRSGRAVRLADGVIREVGPRLPRRPGEQTIEGGGGALLPGLHDHHLHLRGLAAELRSVTCGPPAVTDRAGLAAALRGASPREGWIRGTAYHESVAGPLDRDALDALRPDTPVRIQHRSGMRWHCNSAAVAALRLDDGEHPGIERDRTGRPTGRLLRADDWLRDRVPRVPADLGAVGARLARRGVTGVTDATVTNDSGAAAALAAAGRQARLPQRLHVMGRPGLAAPAGRATVGAVKIVLDETDLPGLSELSRRIGEAHREGRAVGIHAVTRATVILAAAALEEAGPGPGDRIEHASVCPPGTAQRLSRLGVTVVTQPNFVSERGAAYRDEVPPGDRRWLYPLATLDEAGVRLAGGTDAPFGTADPWAAVAAATSRRLPDGTRLGGAQTLPASRALAMFLGTPTAPGGPARRVAPGAPAEVCLLARPLAEVLAAPDRRAVRLVLVGGRLVEGPAAP